MSKPPAKPAKRRGRPPIPAGSRRRQMVSVRFRDEIINKVEQAAQAAGRPVSQEIEHRVERSFERQDLVGEVLQAVYGDQLAELLILVGRTLRNVQYHVHAQRVEGLPSMRAAMRDIDLTDPTAFHEAELALDELMTKLKPPGSPQPLRDEVSVGRYIAKVELIRLMDRKKVPSNTKDDLLRKLLGSEVGLRAN